MYSTLSPLQGVRSRSVTACQLITFSGDEVKNLSCVDLPSTWQSYGTIGPFDAATEDWTSYEQRFTFFFTASKITNADNKQAILLTIYGAATYTLFRSLAAPKKPSEVPIADLLKLAAAHYDPKLSQGVQRFRFTSRKCQAGKSVAVYLAELIRLSEHCSFGDSLDDMFWDRMVCGIQDQLANATQTIGGA